MFNGILFRDKNLLYSVLFAGMGLAVFKLQSMLVSGVSVEKVTTFNAMSGYDVFQSVRNLCGVRESRREGDVRGLGRILI